MTTMNSEHSFSCPKCSEILHGDVDNLHCGACGFSGRRADGIIDLRCGRHDYYFNPVPRPEMAELVRPVAEQDWPRVVRRFLELVKGNPDWLDNLVADGRYAWKMFLSLPPDAVVLDLGCGLGNLVKNIAPQVRRCYAMDLTWERLQFARRRFSIFNADDDIVLIAGGDGRYLPFPDASLDCVTVSGVLEWVADDESLYSGADGRIAKALQMIRIHFGATNPRRQQLAFLKEIRRVLKPDGQLFVAIENRLNYEYFTGRPDHHSALRYGSLLPRLLANLYSIAVNHQPYRTFTYSVPGYRKLLRQAGFSRQEFFGLSPGYSRLERIDPVDANVPYWRDRPPAAIGDRIKRNRFFVPAYGIVNSVSDHAGPRLLERIMDQAGRDLGKGAPPAVTIEDYFVADKDKGVLVGSLGSERVVMKVPFNSVSEAAENNNLALLGVVSGKAGVRAPRPLTSGKVQNLPYFVEERLPGVALSDGLRERGRTALLPDVTALLQAMNPAHEAMEPQALDGPLLDRLVDRPLQRVVSLIDDHGVADRLRSLFLGRLTGRPVKVGLAHGDFSASNIFVEGGRVSGVIDWESGDQAGLPVLDAINYLMSVNMHLSNPGVGLSQAVSLLGTGTWPVGEERAFLDEFFVRCGVEPAHYRDFVYLGWLHHLANQVPFSLIYDGRAIEKRVLPVVNAILDEASSAA